MFDNAKKALDDCAVYFSNKTNFFSRNKKENSAQTIYWLSDEDIAGEKMTKRFPVIIYLILYFFDATKVLIK